MQYSCYRCGAAVEDQTPYCGSCGAPQIRVNVEQQPVLTSDAPVTPPLEPGTPASIQPPALPLHFDQRTAAPRKRFLRHIWPFALTSGIMLGLFFPLGLVLLLGSIVFCIHRYQVNHPEPFSRSDGARLGVLAALLSFIPFVLLLVLSVAYDPETTREAVLKPLQQHAGQTPQYDEMLRFATTQQGFMTLLAGGIMVFLVFLLAIAAITGAICSGPASGRGRS